jgi:prophage regulatory protein
MSNQKLIRIKTVREMTGLSRSYVYALAYKGQFPQPVKLSERSSAWIESEVQAWIDSRIAARGEVLK